MFPSESFDLFNLVPFKGYNYDMGLNDVIFVNRWVKNDFGNISRHVSPDPFCCLKYDADDCESDESLFFEFNNNIELFINIGDIFNLEGNLFTVSRLPLISNFRT